MYTRDANVTPIIEHGGTCRSYFLIGKEELRKETIGGYLEFVGEFELEDGTALEPHSHDSDEFYYILRGEAIMTISGEEKAIVAGEIVRIPRNEIHSIRATDREGFRALALAISFMPEDKIGHTQYPSDGSEPYFVSTDPKQIEE